MADLPEAPKHHHLFHAAMSVRTERLNPRAWALFAGEDFIGRIRRISQACHKDSVSLRTLQRYAALLHQELAGFEKKR